MYGPEDRSGRMRASLFTCYCFLLILLTGCEYRDLISGLSERESLEVVFALQKAGISCERKVESSSRNRSYSISVSQEGYDEAVAVVNEYGFPRKNSEELFEVIKDSPLLPPNKSLNQLKADRVLSIQAEQLMEVLPGVVSVRVYVSHQPEMKADNVGRTKLEKSSGKAIAVIRFLGEGDYFRKESATEVLQKVVPDIPKEAIEIKAYPVQLPTSVLPVGLDQSGRALSLVKLNLFSFRIPEEDLTLARSILATVVIVSGLCTFVIGIIIGSHYLSHTHYGRGILRNIPRDELDSSLVLAHKVALVQKESGNRN